MARNKTSSWLPSWLRHRSLITTEAVLLVGVGHELLGRQISHSSLPNWGKVLFIMASVIGVLGGLMLVMVRLTRGSVAKTHAVASAFPLGTALTHVAVFAALFWLYSMVWNLPVLALR